jgi:hypothetical protein
VAEIQDTQSEKDRANQITGHLMAYFHGGSLSLVKVSLVQILGSHLR